ncbi:MAG: 1-acyl-sn-glycerol-3-phosphate acyltransferase [Rubrivivax sp.]|nr:1-acyl-sn-glycerol-3-phosphate acyltransferase [Rubrivivax sp.]
MITIPGAEPADAVPRTGAPAGPLELLQRPVQLQGSALARGLLRLAGWQVPFDGLPAAQGVVVVYPHTSNWDFVVGLLAKWSIGIPATFWGKDTLFRIPLFGRWLRWLGGVPVQRDAPRGQVGQMVDALRTAREQGRFMWLALAPEGTRRRTEGWRTGFHRVATQAGVPVALVVLDYPRRRVTFDSSWRLSGDLQADFAVFAQRFASGCGFHRDQAAPVRPLSTSNGTRT